MTEDVRFAFRQLRKNPGFAAIAIVTLGLGIGAAAAMFGLIQGVLLSPPVVRASGEPAALAALVRAQLRTIDPTSAVERITTMAELRRESVASRTFAMRLLIGFAVAATLLAVVGLYGVLSLSVNSRIKEMAVRKAVGAQSRQIIQLIVVEGSRMVLAGLVIGAMVAVLVGRLLKTLLFDVKPSDPMALGIAAIAFGAVAIAAGLLPAYRASRVELMEALRQE